MRLTPRRLLSISGVLMLLTAVAHTIGNLTPNADPSVIDLQDPATGSRWAWA